MTQDDALERLFHEPSRMAILSALCAAGAPVPFTDLRDACSLTDGNLNRHLHALADAGVVTLHKAFVDDKPRTTIALTREGLSRFVEHLDKLAVVIEDARRAARRGRQEGRLRQTAAARA